MATVRGIDVSKYQGMVDWTKIRTDRSIRFCYVRASLGRDDRDPRFGRNWAGSAGLLRGAYHAFWPGRTGRQQFDNFMGAYAPAAGDLVPMIDVEKYERPWTVGRFVREVRKLLELVTAEIGRKPFVYTANWFWESIGNPDPLDDYPLWVAHYTRATRPRLPKGWSSWTLWQFTDRAVVPGITENTCDMNRFAGTLADLNTYRI